MKQKNFFTNKKLNIYNCITIYKYMNIGILLNRSGENIFKGR